MTTKQELKDRLAARTAEVVELRREVNALNRELTDASAQLAARQTDAPGPRPFRVGDRVRVAEGATYRQGDRAYPVALAPGEGVVTDDAGNCANLTVAPLASGAWVSPECCAIIEPAPEPPAPNVRVRAAYLDDVVPQIFDADEIALMESAPVYALLKDGAVVACVPVAGVRSVEVVR